MIYGPDDLSPDEKRIRALQARLDAATDVVEAARKVRTGLGLTAYEGTPVSVWSAKHYEKMLGEALAVFDGLARSGTPE